ncbi:hypothetical protein CU663_28700, partial [Pseudomonas syringae pv. actinidifoliorum]|nr:hypothetical protein [Pseudomonas syringae pv. actinidifoliorum]
LCRLDEQKVCLGCFRHVEDIREWRSARRPASADSP